MDSRRQTQNVGLEKLFSGNIESYRPNARQFDVQDVRINLDSPVLEVWIEDFSAQILYYMAAHGGTSSVSEDQIAAYIKYAVVCRVAKVTNDRAHRWEYDHRIPSLLHSFLSMIGYAESAELGIRLVPKIEGEIVIPSQKELNHVSLFFASMEKSFGFEMVKGIPTARSGEWAFMSMEVVENIVLATDAKHHPQYAVVAAFFQAQGLATILGASAFRVQYIPVERASSVLRGVSYVRG